MTAGPPDRPKQQNMPSFVQAQPEIAIEFKSGDIVGGAYEIIDLLGQGGMGNIYRARHNIMMEEYALKTLRAENLTDVSWKRFQKEAQAIGRMNHPNIVAIYNFGLHNGTVPYYVMAQLQGKTLHDLVGELGPMPLNEALPIFVEVCNGMGYAHKKGVVHRDLKPPNIVVMDTPQPGSRVKIVDFGIVKLSEDAGSNQQLTNIGEVCGSPYYMSPEQCEAGTIDARSDVYSIGCTLFEVLTGAPPFRGRNVVDTMLKHQSATPATLQAASGGKIFPPLLERIVAKMLAKSPNDRYQTMEEAAIDLQMVIDGKDPYANSPARSPAPQTVLKENDASRPLAVTSDPARDFSKDSARDQGRDHARGPAPDYTNTAVRKAIKRSDSRDADSEQSQSNDDEPESYQTAASSHFFRLMLGVFVVLIVTLVALGYWWIQLKPASRQSPTPPPIAPVSWHYQPLQLTQDGVSRA